MSTAPPTISTTAPPPKPPTEVELVKAGAEVDAARLQAPALRFAAMLLDIEAAWEENLASSEAPPADALATEACRTVALEQGIAAAVRECFPDELDASAVGHLLQAVLDQQDEAERVRRLYEALRERADRRAAQVEKGLLPLVLAWCESRPPTKGSSWKFPTTAASIVSKNYKDGKLEIAHPGKALESIKKALGSAAYDVLRVETTVLVGAAREALVAAKVDPATLQGVRWTPPGPRKEIRRG